LDKGSQELLLGYLTKADDKLRVAKNLLLSKDYEDSVSRSYYAAFHAAQALLLSEGLSAETHRGVVTLFGLHFIKPAKMDPKFGRYLKNLKDDREEGDYDIGSLIDPPKAENALREATEFVAEARRHLNPLLQK
jgi:uncharacterized protein (UPF0332 family)